MYSSSMDYTHDVIPVLFYRFLYERISRSNSLPACITAGRLRHVMQKSGEGGETALCVLRQLVLLAKVITWLSVPTFLSAND